MKMISRKKTLKLTSTLLLVLIFSLTTLGATHVVSKDGAQFSSIQAVIDAAEPGDTVQVREGTYKENLSVDKDLTLKGVGASKVKIDGRIRSHPVLRIGPSEVKVTVKDLTLQGAEEDSCKVLEKGQCSFGLAAIGDSAFRVKGAIISGNAGGIWLLDSSQATVENSKITGNKWDGIKLEGSSQATVEKGNITGNGGGIWLLDSAQAIVKNSKISGNKWDGIKLEGSSRATIKNNSIRKNDIGVANYSGNKIKFYDNEITNNSVNFTGDIVSTTRDKLKEPTKKKIRLPNENYPSLQHAIDALLPGGRIVITGRLTGRAVIDKELTIESGGKDAKLLSSHKDKAPILSLINGAKLNLNGIRLEDSGGDAIILGGNGKLLVRKSIITGNESNGILLYNSAQATVKNSEIKENGEDGIKLEGSAQATLEKCKITGNHNGILLKDSAQATVENSKITGNGVVGIWLWDSARATVKKGEITGSMFGLWLDDSAQATVENSKISGNDVGISLEVSARVTVQNNYIRKNKVGIDIDKPEKFKGTLEGFGNQLAENEKDFKFIPEPVQRELVAKTRKVNASVGKDEFQFIQAAIFAADPGETVHVKPGTYEESLEINKDLILKGEDKSEVTIKSGKKPHSVVLVGPSDIKVTIKKVTLRDTHPSKCKSSRVCPNGIYLDGKADLKLENVTIKDSGKEGISVRDNAKVTLLNSTIKDNRRRGMWLAGSASAVIKNSKIINNTNYGIEFWHSSFQGSDKVDTSSQLKLVNSVVEDNKWGGSTSRT